MSEHVAPHNMMPSKTFADFCADLWFGKTFILVGMFLGLFVAAAFVYSATPYYRAQIIISPANPMNGEQVSSMLGDDNLFAVRYLMQRVGVANSANFSRFETTYGGPSVAALLLKDPAILRGLKADKFFSFSKSQKSWDAAILADYITQRVRLEGVRATTMRRLVYHHPDPDFGRYFLQNIHRITDELIRLKIKQQAGEHVRYLRDAIDETKNPEHKRAMTTLLMEQERLRMLVSIESPYAANVIEPAAASTKVAWPDTMFVFPLGGIMGAFLGFILFSIREAIVIAQYSDESFEAPQEEFVSPARVRAKQKAQERKYGYWYRLDQANVNDSNSADQVQKKDSDAG